DFGIEGLGGVAALALAPDGKVLYAAGRLDDAIAAFSVNPADGTLVPLGVVAQAQGLDGLNGVQALAFSADGSHLFAIAGENQALSAYARAANGTLTQVALVQNFELATDALVDPAALVLAGKHLVVADAGSDRIAAFGFAPDQGFSLAWTLADGEGVSGMVAPRALAYAGEQARLYVAAAASLHLFSLLDGAPQPLASYDSADAPALAGVAALALGPQQRLLYSVADVPGGAIASFGRERGSRCASTGLRRLDGQLVDVAPGGEVAFQLQGVLFANAAGMLEYSVTATPRSA